MQKKAKLTNIIITSFFLLNILACNKYQVDPSLVYGELDNGLSYFVYENKNPKQSISLRLVVKSGSVHEADDQQGIAHFLEHLAFNGTKNFPKDSIIKELESIGVKYGSQLNAYTSYDHTVYEIDLPLDKSSNFDKALAIIRDWADGLSILDEEVQKEREIILQEERDRKNAHSKMHEQFYPLLFEDSPYANRRPIGLSHIIATVSPKRIRDFYQDFYKPYRMGLFIVGDMPATQVVKQIKEKFTNLGEKEEFVSPKQWESQEKEFLTIPDNKKSHFVIHTDTELDRCSFWQINRIPTPSFSNPLNELKHDLLYALASALIQQQLNQKFHNQQGEETGITASYTSTLGYARYKDFHLTGFNLDNKKIATAYQSGYQELCNILNNGITESQLTQQKSRILKNLQDDVDEQHHRTSKQIVSSMYGYYLNGKLLPSRKWILKKGSRLLKKITANEVHQMIKTIAALENRVVVLFYPKDSSSTLPTANEFEQTILSIQNNLRDEATVPSNSDEKLKELLLPQDLVSGKIESKETIDYLSTTKYLLSNKLTVYSRPSSLTKNNLTLSFYSKGGTSLADDKNFANAELADDLFYYSSIANLSNIQKNLWLERNAINLELSIDEMEESLSISGSFTKAKQIFTLVAAIFSHINATPEDFSYTKSNYINYAHQFQNNPNNWFSKQLNQLLRNKGIRHPHIDEAAAKETTYEATLQFLKSRFNDASDFICIITGNYSQKKIEKFLTTHLAALPSDNDITNKESFLPVFNPYPKTNSVNHYKRNKEKQALVYQLYHQDQYYNIDLNRNLQAATSILSRVFDLEIREKESGTYSIGAFASLRKEPFEELIGGIVFSCDPNRLNELKTKTALTLKEFLDGNWDEELLNNFKKSSILIDKENRQKDSYWASLILQTELGLITQEDFINMEEHINNISKDDILKSAKLLFTQGNSTEAVLLPID